MFGIPTFRDLLFNTVVPTFRAFPTNRDETTWLGHAVAQLVEALSYKPAGHGSIPDGVTGIFL
jgi:hypothetical protein